MTQGFGCFFALMALLVGTAANGAGPTSIFDDDWTPPKRSEAARPVLVKPVTPAPAEPGKPADPTATAPQEPAPVTPVAAGRRAIPAKAELAAVRKVLKDVFAEQLLDRSIAARRKLTEALLGQAEKSADAPVEQFVLLAAAVDAGTEASDLRLAFAAGDRMAKAFEVDGLSIKAEAAAKLAPKPGAADLAAENVRAALELVEQLAEVDDFGAAGRVCAAVAPMAAGNPALRAEVLKRQREMSAAREASEKVAKHVEKLKTAPDDAAANLEVGKYLCFFRNDWKSGLSALARGSDAALKALAIREMGGADDADARASLGDAWWDLAQAAAGPNKAAMQARAADWYAKAAPDLKGLVKAKVDKRLAQLDPKTPAGAGPVDPRSIIRARAPGGTSVLLFRGNGRGLADFQAVSGGKVVSVGPDQIPRLFANANTFSKYNVIVWEANALCDSHIDLDDSYGETMRRFVEIGGDVVVFEQFRETNWHVLEKPFGIKRKAGGPHDFGEIDPGLAAKVKAAGIGDEEIAKIRFVYTVETPERSTTLVRNKRNEVLATVIPLGKGRFIFTAASGEVDHAKFDRVFFEYLFQTK